MIDNMVKKMLSGAKGFKDKLFKPNEWKNIQKNAKEELIASQDVFSGENISVFLKKTKDKVNNFLSDDEIPDFKQMGQSVVNGFKKIFSGDTKKEYHQETESSLLKVMLKETSYYRAVSTVKPSFSPDDLDEKNLDFALDLLLKQTSKLFPAITLQTNEIGKMVEGSETTQNLLNIAIEKTIKESRMDGNFNHYFKFPNFEKTFKENKKLHINNQLGLIEQLEKNPTTNFNILLRLETNPQVKKRMLGVLEQYGRNEKVLSNLPIIKIYTKQLTNSLKTEKERLVKEVEGLEQPQALKREVSYPSGVKKTITDNQVVINWIDGSKTIINTNGDGVQTAQFVNKNQQITQLQTNQFNYEDNLGFSFKDNSGTQITKYFNGIETFGFHNNVMITKTIENEINIKQNGQNVDVEILSENPFLSIKLIDGTVISEKDGKWLLDESSKQLVPVEETVVPLLWTVLVGSIKTELDKDGKEIFKSPDGNKLKKESKENNVYVDDKGYRYVEENGQVFKVDVLKSKKQKQENLTQLNELEKVNFPITQKVEELETENNVIAEDSVSRKEANETLNQENEVLEKENSQTDQEIEEKEEEKDVVDETIKKNKEEKENIQKSLVSNAKNIAVETVHLGKLFGELMIQTTVIAGLLLAITAAGVAGFFTLGATLTAIPSLLVKLGQAVAQLLVIIMQIVVSLTKLAFYAAKSTFLLTKLGLKTQELNQNQKRQNEIPKELEQIKNRKKENQDKIDTNTSKIEENNTKVSENDIRQNEIHSTLNPLREEKQSNDTQIFKLNTENQGIDGVLKKVDPKDQINSTNLIPTSVSNPVQKPVNGVDGVVKESGNPPIPPITTNHNTFGQTTHTRKPIQAPKMELKPDDKE